MATVDVLMPVREPAPWLRHSLDGLMEESDVDWRLVLVVHGPDEATSRTADRYPVPLTLCHADASCSLSEVLNVGLANCTAPFVARVDSDDVPLRGRLAETSRRLAEDPDLTAVASWSELVDADGRVAGRGPRPSDEANLLRALRWRNAVVHSSVTFRRTTIIDLGGYTAGLSQVEDYELWLRVLAHGRFGLVPEVLVQHRVHPDQVSRIRAVPAASARAVGASRLALADGRGESGAAARLRHAAWSGLQTTRRWHRG